MNNLNESIKKTLEAIRPYIQRDGGDLEFIKFENKTVYIRLLGACVGCSLSDVTVKEGIQEIMREEYPGDVDIVELIPE